MGGGENPTYSLIFSKMFLFLFMIFFISTVMHIHGVKKLVVYRHSMYRRSGGTPTVMK